MTNSPEPPQQDERRSGVSPLDFDEWVALLLAFGILGGIFFWALRPQTGQTGGSWLGALGNGDAGLLQGDAATLGSNAEGGLGAGLGLGNGADDSSFAANISGKQDDADADRSYDSDASTGAPSILSARRGTGALAGAAAGAGLLAGGAAADDTAAAETPTAEATTAAAIDDSEGAGTDAADADAVVAESDTVIDTTAEAPTETPATVTEEPIVVATEAPETSIPEIAEDSWLYPFAASLEESDRLGELPTAETFDIDAPVTRAEFASLVSQAEQVEGDAGQAAGKFEDIGEAFWASPRIAGALETGFMSGYGTLPDGRQLFGPTEEIPRYQALVAIASGLDLTPPDDVDAVLSAYDTEGMPDWAKEKVAAALSEGLVINPADQTKLEPLRSTTRGEATAMLQQVLQREGKVTAVESSVTVTP